MDPSFITRDNYCDFNDHQCQPGITLLGMGYVLMPELGINVLTSRNAPKAGYHLYLRVVSKHPNHALK